MSVTHTASVEERRQDHRRRWRIGMLLSFFVHLCIFLLAFLLRVDLAPIFEDAPEGPAVDDEAAGGMTAMNVRVARPDPITPPDGIPVPAPVEIEILDETVPEVQIDRTALAQIAAPPARGRGEGQGDRTGDASGAGGGGSGGNSRTVPPSPLGVIIPPADDDLKGKKIEIWVFVGVDGRVVPDSTRLRPPTSNERLNDRLRREASEWRFTPARRSGTPVAAWFPYTISM